MPTSPDFEFSPLPPERTAQFVVEQLVSATLIMPTLLRELDYLQTIRGLRDLKDQRVTSDIIDEATRRQNTGLLLREAGIRADIANVSHLKESFKAVAQTPEMSQLVAQSLQTTLDQLEQRKPFIDSLADSFPLLRDEGEQKKDALYKIRAELGL